MTLQWHCDDTSVTLWCHQRKGGEQGFWSIVSSISASPTQSGCLSGSGSHADYSRYYCISIPSLEGLATLVLWAKTLPTVLICRVSSWDSPGTEIAGCYFCTAMQGLSKKIFPLNMSPGPSPDYMICSYSHMNTPWRPCVFSHISCSELYFFLFSTSTHSIQSVNRAISNFWKAHISYLFLTVVPQKCKKKITQPATVLSTSSYILYPLIHI